MEQVEKSDKYTTKIIVLTILFLISRWYQLFFNCATQSIDSPIYLKFQMELNFNSLTGLLKFFQEFKGHIFYVGPLYKAALSTIRDYIPNFQYLACSDPFLGANSSFKVPQNLENHVCMDYIQCQVDILKNAATLAYMRQKDPKPNVLIGQITPELEQFCRENDLNYWGVPAELFEFLGNKVKLIDVLKSAEIPFIPNVCQAIKNYEQLKEIGDKFGTSKIVAQNQEGFGGRGTIFISNQEDYNANKKILQVGRKFKVMPFRRVKAFAIDGIATRSGVVLGPLLAELIGHPELTPRRGGYCGNQLRKTYFENAEIQTKVRKEIFYYAEKFGNFIYQQYNYRGFFGLDFVVDEDTNEVFMMEINPRMTGPCCITYQVYENQGHKFPLLLFHCLEFLDVEIGLDFGKLNKEWIGTEHYQDEVSYICFKGTLDYGFCENIVPAGTWQLREEELVFTGSPQVRIDKMKQEDLLFIPDVISSSGALLVKGRCQDYRFKLSNSGLDLINRFMKIGKKFMNKV